MDKAGDLLKAFLSFYNLEKGEKYVSLFSGWRQIAGEDLASHTRVVDIRLSALVVEVDHPGWMQLLQIKQEDILLRIGQKFPELGIRVLQMKLVKEGDFSDIRSREKPLTEPRPAETPPELPAEAEPPSFSPDALQAIKDEELKNLLARLGKKVREKNRKTNKPLSG